MSDTKADTSVIVAGYRFDYYQSSGGVVVTMDRTGRVCDAGVPFERGKRMPPWRLELWGEDWVKSETDEMRWRRNYG